MSSDDLRLAIGRMILAFNSRPNEEKIEVYVDATTDAGQCEGCAIAAARRIAGEFKRMPVPAVFVEETAVETISAAHATHVADRGQLTSGDPAVWWRTEAPQIVKELWSELTADQSISVAGVLGSMGFVRMDRNAIAVEIGFVDRRGPSVEREWWHGVAGISAEGTA